MKNNLSAKLLTVSILCFLYSCKDVYQDSSKMIFRYNEATGISSLDPAFARTQNNIWAVHQLYNKLVRIDDSLHIVGDIARKWMVSEDALRYKFILKKNIYYHLHTAFGIDSTRQLTAADVVYSYDRLTDRQTASPGGWVLKNVDGYSAVNDSIFEIVLKKPFPGFLGLLSTPYCSIVPREVVDYYGSEFGQHPIGTGPFQMQLWKKNIKLVLLKNPNYHERDQTGVRLPYLDAVNISFIPDKQSEFLEFIKGKLDLLNGVHVSYKDELLDFKGKLNTKYSDKINLLTIPYLNTEYIGFNMESEGILQSKYIRQALNYAFDRDKMIQYLLNGLGTNASWGMIPSSMPGGGNKQYYQYDIDRAKALIAEHRQYYGKDEPLEITLSTDKGYLSICEYLQSQFEKIGIHTQIDLMTGASLKQSKSNGKLSMFRASWIADYPDAENYLSLFYSKNKAPLGPNYTRFHNAKYDEIYEQSLSKINDQERYRYYQQLDSIIAKKCPVIPLYYDRAVRFVGKDVKGMQMNPINLLNLKRVKKLF